MARLSSDTREKILADWKTGHYSQNKLAKEYEVSPATINKICKDIKQENASIVNTQVALNVKLSDKSEYEVNSIHLAVEERTKHLIFFQNSALKNQKLANELVNESSKIYDLKAHADLTSKNKQTVLGKDIETEININNTNAQQNNLETTGIRIVFGDDE